MLYVVTTTGLCLLSLLLLFHLQEIHGRTGELLPPTGWLCDLIKCELSRNLLPTFETTTVAVG